MIQGGESCALILEDDLGVPSFPSFLLCTSLLPLIVGRLEGTMHRPGAAAALVKILRQDQNPLRRCRIVLDQQ